MTEVLLAAGSAIAAGLLVDKYSGILYSKFCRWLASLSDGRTIYVEPNPDNLASPRDLEGKKDESI